jgi:hypothetical protein
MKVYHQRLTQISVYIFVVVVFTSCATMAFSPNTSFNSSNDVKNVRATVILQDNSSMLGYLTLKNKVNEQQATVRLPQQRKTIDLAVHHIKAYEIEDAHYALKTIEPYTTQIYVWGKPFAHKSFVRRLTPPEYAIQLYSHEEKIKEEKSSLTRTVTHYFVEFNHTNPEQLIDITHPDFLNQYKKQLQILTKQCAALEEKIDAKESAYSITKRSKNAKEKSSILFNIAKLYHECSTK